IQHHASRDGTKKGSVKNGAITTYQYIQNIYKYLLSTTFNYKLKECIYRFQFIICIYFIGEVSLH
ncbi:hypothetical protein MJN51_19245, partial [Salmonella enterica subsp. enterica serovar Kentucky]|uniref:hypothetical protein n=1 Tax=Salmonella enterica TaxID=28901 RepID=UPI0024AC42D1|nr:hypothetical protein [Salmonella enterica subsp. enterica serovar Kentucky]